MKRKLLSLLASLPLLPACVSADERTARNKSEAREKAYYDALSPEEKRLHESLKKKFHEIYGLVLKIDATSIKEGVTLTNERGRYIAAPGLLAPGGSGNQTYTDNSMPIPKTIRATWRIGKFEQKAGGGGWIGGTIIGDYNVPVAERIPDSILDYIRENGGALRLKIRLKDDGILIGWDVEHVIPYKDWKPNSLGLGSGVSYRMPGGDFLDTHY